MVIRSGMKKVQGYGDQAYQLVSPKPLTRPFVLKYVKLLGFANQASQPPLKAPWGVTHE